MTVVLFQFPSEIPQRDTDTTFTIPKIAMKTALSYVFVAITCLCLSGCGTSAYNEKIEAAMRSAPRAAATDDVAADDGDNAAAVAGNPARGGPRPSQVLGGNRQSVLGQPLNAANRLVAQNKANQIAQTMFQYELNNGEFPAQAIADASGTPLLSWRVKMLESLDPNLFRMFKTDEAWDGPTNQSLVDRMPDVFDVGYDLPAGHTAILALVGDNTVIQPGQGTRSAGITDGPGNTIVFVIGSSEAAVPWTQPTDIAVDASDPLRNVLGGDNTFMAAFADGRVVRVKNTDPVVVYPFFTKSGGEAVRLSDLD